MLVMSSAMPCELIKFFVYFHYVCLMLTLHAASGLMLYQCLTPYKGSDSSELSLNKNDIVKVLDKKDHGMYAI